MNLNAGLPKFFCQALRGRLQRIDLDGQRRDFVVGGQKPLRLLPAQQIDHAFREPLGMAVLNGQPLNLIPVRNGRQRFLVLGNLTENSVDKAGRLSPLRQLCQLHRGIDGGAVGNFVKEKYLVRTDAQNLQKGRLQMIRLLRAIGTDIEVQQHLVLHDTVDDAAAKCRVRAGQAVPADLGFQSGVRPGTVAAAAHQHPQCSDSG